MPTVVNPVGWFEIPVTDMARAVAFYEHVFGVKLALHDMGPLQMAWFPMQNGEYGATGTLVKNENYKPSHAGTLVYFTAADIDATLQRVTERGGKVLRARTGIGEYGFVGHFEDSEGNRVALHSPPG
jgi:predicted enzyme related to lactoylglutathione lyase